MTAKQAGARLQRAASCVDAPAWEAYAQSMDYRSIITIDPGRRSGKPCIRGLRITVTDVLEYMASGVSVEEMLSDVPDLTADDI